MIDLNKQRETVHNAINTLFDIAKVQKSEIDMLNVDVANKQAEIDSLKAQLAKIESGEFVVVPKNPSLLMQREYYKNSVAPVARLSVNGYRAMIKAAQENSHE